MNEFLNSRPVKIIVWALATSLTVNAVIVSVNFLLSLGRLW